MPRDPRSPAGVAANMGYNLFIAKGLRPTRTERIRSALSTQSQALVVAILALVLGTVVVVALKI